MCFRLLACALLAAVTLTGCGLRGPLYLPAEPQEQDSASEPGQKE
jgi:predicted small lipoprotein YifL